MDVADVVVVGAGVVGLACARAFAEQGREVLLLEQADAIGTGISSRNSEVIHAGIHYPPGSLKARLCVQGRDLLYAYCAERGVAHRRCGKLIVATAPSQQAQLALIRDQALANGVTDLQWLTQAQAQTLEPALRCTGALFSPSTGIVDSHGLMQALRADLEQGGGTLVLRCAFESARRSAGGIELHTADGAALQARVLVNAAGLAAPLLARRIEGVDAARVPTPHYAKGNYFSLVGRAPFAHLIYPIPAAAGLGVHLTLDLAGAARFGPDVQWVDAADDLVVDASRAAVFQAEVRRYWPALPDGALRPAYAGMRPKLQPESAGVADFVLQGPRQHGVAGLVNLFGIESPGLTSALAIAQGVLRMAQSP